jgi:hypothetical protein
LYIDRSLVDKGTIDFANSPAVIFEPYIQKKGGWVSNYISRAFIAEARMLIMSDAASRALFARDGKADYSSPVLSSEH